VLPRSFRREPEENALRAPIAPLFLLATCSVVGAASTGHEAEGAKPRLASGRVVDVHGAPVAGAAIEVSITDRQYRSVTIGQGLSGADGGFMLPLATADYGDLGVGVDAPGFAHWGAAGFPQGVVDEEIVLRQIVDRGFLDDLGAIRDPAERARRVLEIVTSEDAPVIEEMFPYLGAMRPELAAIVRAGIAEPKTRDGSSPADHATRLLAYWADPADDEIVVPWVIASWGARPAHVAHLGLSAASIGGVCALWRELHFADQGIADDQPWSPCTELVVDATRTHALALFRVSYAHWGYDMHLRGVSEGRIHHYR
jgi:hypothetical protein